MLALLEDVLAQLDDTPTRERTLLLAQLPGEQTYARPLEERSHHFAAALTIADGTDDPSLRVIARWARHVGFLGTGAVRSSCAVLEEALAIALDVGTPFDEWLCRATLVSADLYAGELDGALAAAQGVLELGQSIGQADAVNWWGGSWAAMQWFRGTPDEAVAMATMLSEQFPSAAAVWHASAASTLLAGGRRDEARALAERTGLLDPSLDLTPSPALGATLTHLTVIANAIEHRPRAERLQRDLEDGWFGTLAA